MKLTWGTLYLRSCGFWKFIYGKFWPNVFKKKKRTTGKTKQQQKTNQNDKQCPMNEAGELRKLYGSGSVWTTNGCRSGLCPEEWWCGFSSYMFPQTLTSANDNIIDRWTFRLHSAWKLLDSCVTTHLICKVKVDLSLQFCS